MSREEARRIVIEWGEDRGNWFSPSTDEGLFAVDAGGFFDFEALLDALGVPR